MIKYLLCENCYQVIAQFDPARLRQPVRSSMFLAKYADRGQRPFWSMDLPAADMRCPMCPKRIFNVPDPVDLYCSDTIDGLDAYRIELKGKVVEQMRPSNYGPICPMGEHQWSSKSNEGIEMVDSLICLKCGMLGQIEGNRQQFGFYVEVAPETDAPGSPTGDDLDKGNTEACTENTEFPWQEAKATFTVDPKDIDACPTCGKPSTDFKTPQGFGGHVKACERKHGGRSSG